MMTKEELIALGLTEEQATKAAAASVEELKSYIPKARFDEVNEAKKQAEKDRDTVNGQMEELKKSAGVSEELKGQIETLQAENKAAKEKYVADMKDLALTNAIKLALAGKVHDEGLAAGLVDKAKLVIDGDKVVGLDEQIKTLKESKTFLFKEEKTEPTKPGFKVGGDGKQPPAGDSKPSSLFDAVASHFSTK